MAGEAVSPTAMSLFSDILVLDLTSTIRGMHCTKMFGDYGAEVILVEPVGGSRARQIGPLPMENQVSRQVFTLLTIIATRRALP
jgi:crotonobetainyl-CoA:carnitine CoA-transferase CaiB-like acyl-CoA transferase